MPEHRNRQRVKRTYIGTFVPGFQKLAHRIVAHHFSDASVPMVLDGLIVFSTARDPRGLPYFNNIFLQLHRFGKCGPDPLSEMLDIVARSKGFADLIIHHKPVRNASFRIVTSRENRLVPVDNRLLERAEKHLASMTGMRVDRSRPDVELWCLHRRERVGFFMMRLTRHATTARMLHKGELRPELASLLCALSDPADNDVFMDPFCGYGSIPIARARLAPFRMICALDTDQDKITQVRKKIRELGRQPEAVGMQITCADAFDPALFEERSFDKIVTDPPWRIFDTTAARDIDSFYHVMVRVYARLLKPGGILVVLTAQKELFIDCIQAYRGTLEAVDTYDILVSGKKAGVYKVIKR